MRTAFSTNNRMFRYAQHDKNIIPFLLDMTKPRSVFLCHSELSGETLIQTSEWQKMSSRAVGRGPSLRSG